MTETSLDSAPAFSQLRNRDRQAFTHLVRCYHHHFIVIARSIVGDGIADEVVQEAWISIFAALPDFEERSSLKSWMYTVVSNEAKSRLRKEKRHLSLDDTEFTLNECLGGDRFDDSGSWRVPFGSWHTASPESLLEEAELRRCIEKTMELLPPMQKAVLLLRDIEQQRIPDICSMLNLNSSNASVLLHRARLKLMRIINHYLETGQC